MPDQTKDEQNGNIKKINNTDEDKKGIKDKLNKETIINEKSVKELETTLSSLNSKTCNYDKQAFYF